MVLANWNYQMKLVLSLLASVDRCHIQNILLNDLLPSNIMPHFLQQHSKEVHIKVSD